MTENSVKKFKTCIVCKNEMKASETWLYQCPQCKFLHSSLPAGAGTGVDGLEKLREDNFKKLLKILEKTCSMGGKSLLEIGCSTGIFLDATKGKGLNAIGIEPEKEKANIARAKNHTIIDGFFPDSLPKEQKYDFIIFNDVFEHLPDPVAALEACNHHLTKNGILIVNIPDSRGFLYALSTLFNKLGIKGPFERMWQKQFASPHITYFNHKNLKKLVENKTSLELISYDRMDSMSKNGLKRRIRASVNEPYASLIFIPLYIATFIQRILPSDILVHIYRKNL